MKKWFIGFLSLVTMSTMLISSISITTLAANDTSDAGNTADDSVFIVQEDVSLRGEYEKHFLMSDGSYCVTVYNEPVHQAVDGVWEEIDNTLRLSTNAEGVSRYKTANGLTEVSFAKNFQSELVTMKQDDYSISWGLTAVSGNSGVISMQAAAEAQLIPMDLSDMSAEEVKTMALNSTSTIRYSNALAQDVDVEYVVLPSRVKENIILKSPRDIAAYVMNIYTENLSARLLANNQIEFYNSDGDVIFTMWAPYMYDSAAELSEDIALQLVSKGTGYYILTMVPNAQWLNDPSRVYPIVIDPNTSPNSAQQNIIDTYVLEGQGVQNSSLDRLYIGKKSGATARAFIKYSHMPYLPVGTSIKSATQTLTITQGANTAYAASAYRVMGGDWSPGTLTWANKPGASLLIATNISHNDRSYYSFSCLSAVTAWYSGDPTGKNANYGIMVRYADESINDYNAFYSGDYSVESSRPQLTIHYVPPLPQERIVWPVPNNYNVTSKWGYRNFSGRVHRGIDIGCVEGTTLVAAIDGVVKHIYGEAIGNGLIITKPGTDFQVHYYHLKKDGYLVQEGATVSAGDPVAYSGNTGTSTGPHLHFQLQYGDSNSQLYNPLDTYHPDDKRYNWTNPNPMFYYSNGVYIPNPSFNFVYTASDYNDDDSNWKR